MPKSIEIQTAYGISPRLSWARLLHAFIAQEQAQKNDCADIQDCPAGLETEEDDTMAEDANATVETTQTENTPAVTEQTAPAPQTYTAEEVARLVQAEADRRVTQALSKQQKEYEKKLSLSALDEQERVMAEKDLRIQELEEKLRENAALINKQEVVKTLASRGLPVAFADLIDIGTDLPEAQKKLEALDAGFRKAVEDEVKSRLAGKLPPGKGAGAPSMSREQFRKLRLAEKQALYERDPELYKQLTE